MWVQAPISRYERMILLKHTMHEEWLTVDHKVCDQIKHTKEQGGRVIAVGTTSVRSLETAFKNHKIEPYAGPTDIFIYPGYDFKVIDGLITNFHLPKSSLLMLVGALAGVERMQAAYHSSH